MSKIKEIVTLPKLTFALRFLLDECIPPVLRDRRWFFAPIAFAYNRKMDLDFKRRACSMTRREFRQAYLDIVPTRSTDLTPKTIEFVMKNLAGESILEVGCGNGDLSLACAERGYGVVATDLADGKLKEMQSRAQGRSLTLQAAAADIEELPFPDRCFDTTLCLHTLEHVMNLPAAIGELKRVTKNRLIVVVPRERFYRYTCNYHLHFFGAPEQLMLWIQTKTSNCRVIDGAICYAGDV